MKRWAAHNAAKAALMRVPDGCPADRDGTALHVPGLYERIRTRELKLAFAPDPRLHFVKDDPVAYEAALATAPTYSPDRAVPDVEELLARKPVRLPRWLLGGRVACPEARWLGTVRGP